MLIEETGNAGSVRVLLGVMTVAFFELPQAASTSIRDVQATNHLERFVVRSVYEIFIALDMLQSLRLPFFIISP